MGISQLGFDVLTWDYVNTFTKHLKMALAGADGHRAVFPRMGPLQIE